MPLVLWLFDLVENQGQDFSQKSSYERVGTIIQYLTLCYNLVAAMYWPSWYSRRVQLLCPLGLCHRDLNTDNNIAVGSPS